MAKTLKPNALQNKLIEKVKKQYSDLFTKQDEFPTPLSHQEVEALKARIVELEAETGNSSAGSRPKYEATTSSFVRRESLPKSPASAPVSDGTRQAQNAFRIAVTVAVLSVLGLPVNLYAFSQSRAWQVAALIVASLTISATAAISAVLARRNRTNLAVGLMVGTWLIIIPLMVALVDGLGLVLAPVLLLGVALVVRQTLSGTMALRVWLLSVLSAAVTLLEAFYVPWERFSIPALQTVVPILSITAIVLLAVLAFRSAWETILLNLSTGRKIALIVSVLILGMLGVMVAGLVNLNTMQYHLSNIYDFMLVPITAISDSETRLSNNQYVIEQILKGGLSASDTAQRIQDLQKNDAQVDAVIKRYQDEWVTTTSPEFTQILQNAGQLDLQKQEVATLNDLVTSYAAYKGTEQKFIASLQAGRRDESAANAAIAELGTAMGHLHTLIVINNQFADLSDKAAGAAYGQAGVNMSMVIVIALILGLVLSFFITTSLTRRLAILVHNASEIQQGNFAQTSLVAGRDEVGLLGRTFNDMAAQLTGLFDEMEQRVADRTHDIELATELGRSINQQVANLSRLLSDSAESIRDRFGLYYTQVYLTDPAGRNLILRAGTGEAGQQLLRRGHRLVISSASLNGRAVSERKPVLVTDTQKSGTFLPNPLLPLTRSELAFPLIVGEKVVGVLDMQSEKAGTFNENNLPAYGLLAGQLAIAIQNAALLAETSEARTELEEQIAQTSLSGWRDYLNALQRSERIGFVYNQNEVIPLVETQSSQLDNTLAIPIQVSGASVGEIQLAGATERHWTSSETEIIRATVDNVARHIENLRLLAQSETYRLEAEEASQRLTREGWAQYLKARKQLAAGYVYDQNQVHPLNGNGHQSAAPLISHPLVVRDETIGQVMVEAENSADATYTTEMIAAVAEQLSDHIENLRLLEKTEAQRAEADKLYEIGQKLSVAKGRQEIVAAVAENLEFSQINRAVFLSYEYGDSGEVENVAVAANWYSGRGAEPTPLGRRYPAKVFTAVNNFAVNEPSFVANTQTDDRIDPASKEIYQKQQVHAFISLPIWSDAHQVGSLLLQAEETIPFTGEEWLPYTSIMQQLTVALENQGLLEQTQKRANQLEAVASLSSTASTVLDPDKLLQAVVDLTKERLNLYHAHIYLAEPSWQTLLLAAGAGEVGRRLVAGQHSIPMNAEQSLVARAAREQKAVIVNDVRGQADFLPNPLLPDTRAEMAVPMIVGDKVLGVFDVQSENVNGFSQEDAHIYTTLAAQVAIALQNARLYVEQAATVTQLRELDRLKSSFLANMSHELRTPLNSILGFADVMLEELDGPLTENMNNDLGLIQKNGQHLLHLINDVLDMAKIEAGRMNLNPEKFRLHEILDEVTSITSTLASEKNLALFIEDDSDQEVEVYADRTRIRQVMINLVNNSIKFTETGRISIAARQLDNAKVLIKVTDTGIGIPPEKLDAVFQEFIQVDTSSTRKVGGTGLGLPISRRLVEMHGGRLWAESTGVSGEGSTFYVELPLEARVNDIVEKENA